MSDDHVSTARTSVVKKIATYVSQGLSTLFSNELVNSPRKLLAWLKNLMLTSTCLGLAKAPQTQHAK